ncbi:MAG: FtsX-like permease family protein [Lachnospiraceae bacterium]|jgi:putative ABC transport system permease protein|nr:FtsX-like permease family protein [Lachnospiraceae bacterium]
MLIKLSWRNAKRQSKDYLLYLITLICSASFLYAFNSLVFSDSVKDISELEILPYLIIATSLLIIFILGWIVSYMMSYMLRKRSKELSIYMVSGLPNKKIRRIFFCENSIIGGIALGIGILFGLLLAQLLEAALLHVFRETFHLAFRISLPALGLTAVYFLGIFLFALLRNGRWIRKAGLYDMLYFDKQKEGGAVTNKVLIFSLFLLSLSAGAGGFLTLILKPFQYAYNMLAGLTLLVLFLFGFFISVPSILTAWFESKNLWKYKQNRLLEFRGFHAKIRSMSVVMGVLSIIFMLSMIFFGTGIAAGKVASQSIDLNVFDLLILQKDGSENLSTFRDSISRETPVRSSYQYRILTGTDKTFKDIRDLASLESGHDGASIYAEYQTDTYMMQSDYLYLRKMLGYDSVKLDRNAYYLHCIPALKTTFESYLEENDSLKLGGEVYVYGDTFTEPFGQHDAYGNGFNYILIVPDRAAAHLRVLYSLFAVMTETPLSESKISSLLEHSENLAILNRELLVSGTAYAKDFATSIIKPDTAYITGKWATQKEFYTLYSFLLCLFYLAFILEITGTAILATQVLGDSDKKQRQNRLLSQLGMSSKQIKCLEIRQLLILFVLPALPAMAISVCIIQNAANAMQVSGFPLFPNNLWMVQTAGFSIVFFVILYSLYYAAALITIHKQI